MGKFLFALFSLIFVILASTSFIYAVENSYIAFKPSIKFPMIGKSKDFNPGFNFGIAFGNHFSPDVATELEIGFTKTRHTSPDSEKIKTNFNVFPLAWSFKKLVYFEKGEYYGMGGFGVYYIRMRQSEAGHAYVDRETDVGFHAGLGLHYNIAQKLFVGIEGRYLFFSGRPFGKYKMDGIIAAAFFGLKF
jgi:opacity protein-like surface antigen